MDIWEILEEIKIKAKKDPELCRALVKPGSRRSRCLLFCEQCRKLGYALYDMDLLDAGEAFYAAMKRSTNGGGENSPILEGEDDFYELFFADLESQTI